MGYCRPPNKMQLRRMPHEAQARRRAEHQCQKLHRKTGHKKDCKQWAKEEAAEAAERKEEEEEEKAGAGGGGGGNGGDGADGGGGNSAAGGEGGGRGNGKKKGKKKKGRRRRMKGSKCSCNVVKEDDSTNISTMESTNFFIECCAMFIIRIRCD